MKQARQFDPVTATTGGHENAQVAFCVVEGRIVLLHDFVKMTQRTSANNLELAVRRMKKLEQGDDSEEGKDWILL